jgi:peptide deformylase
MTVLNVVKYGDPLLTRPTKAVERFDDSVKQLGIDLLETMRAANGAGMAANQVGDERRVFVMTTETGEDLVFVNPVIVKEGGMQLSSDGCLSFPGVPLCSVRPTLMVIEAQDVTGAPFSTTFGSEMISLDKMERVSRDAMIASHEIDHLDGKMLVDRLSDEAYALAESEFEASVFSGEWQVRLPADGDEYRLEKTRRLISPETSAKLQELMAAHGRRHGSAAAAAGQTHVRGSERVLRARQRSSL